MNQSASRELKMLGKSPEMSRVRKAVKNVAKLDTAVLLVGETGTDKRFIAEHIHQLSARKEGPFVVIPCGAIRDTIDVEQVFRVPSDDKPLDEPQLFAAAKGTLYLERVDRLSADLQERLYNFLTTFSSSKRESRFKARLISSAEPTLYETPQSGGIRQDLLQLLAAFRIDIPPLRDRKQDIPFLFTQLLEQLSQEYGKSMPTIPYSVFEAILDYPWPGNLHEMRNVIRNLVIMSPEGELAAEYLPFFSKPDPLEFLAGHDLPTAVGEVEKFLIRKALTKYEGNQSKAARMLQVSEAALRYKMKKYGFPSAR
ncbi:sigma-54-dependent Fis family transcriptional regulator [candidate division KSB1 bacterium]|nr:sigma-54-dependent Fis family transcriptional regulator [candidate division KSB1 bacterium]